MLWCRVGRREEGIRRDGVGRRALCKIFLGNPGDDDDDDDSDE